MYCPECGGEYRPDIQVCPTCEVPLEAEPRSTSAGPAGPRLAPFLVDLVGYLNEREARDARGQLRRARVPCELVIRDGPAAGAAEPEEEYWIRVPADRARAAAEVLGLDAVLGEDSCPSCGAALEGDEPCPRCAGSGRP